MRIVATRNLYKHSRDFFTDRSNVNLLLLIFVFSVYSVYLSVVLVTFVYG